MEFNERYVTLGTKEYEISINNFNMSVLSQLEEIFPHISVDFLKGICDAYKEETISIDILTELVLSFEFPPLKEDDERNDSLELTINNAVDNESLTSSAEDNRKSTFSGNCNGPKNNSNKTNSIHIKNENNYLNKQITSSKSDNKNCFQYSLEDASSVNPNEILQKKIKVFTKNVKEIDHNIDNKLASTDDFNNCQDLLVIQDSDLNNDIKEEPHKNMSHTKKSTILRGRIPARSTRQPLFRSCKVKCNEYNIVNNKKFLAENSNKSRKKIKQSSTRSLDSSSKFETSESKHILLSKIFPNANSDYLLSQSQKIANQEELLIFISQTLDNRNYPIKETKSGVENTIMNKFYCNIEKFLEEYPDPIAEFSSHSYTRTGYEQNAEIYLSSRYQNLDPEQMKNLLNEHNYNLTTLCAELEAEGFEPSPYFLDNISLYPHTSIYFHMEVWFIEHKTEIQNFLASVVEAAKVQEELNKPVIVDEVFECNICSEEITEYSELRSCDNPTGHLFCKTCIKRSVEIKIGEGSTTFPCLANCGGFIDLQTVKELLPNGTFDILMNKIQEEEIRIANIPGVETCPFCHFAYGPDEKDDLFTCQNPTCMKKSCRTCREEDHSPNMCAMFQNENEETARHYIENKMTEALIRHCYKCGKSFVKETGCNKMACTCGALMCYLCRKPVADYTHFNAQGGENYDRCELFSKEEKIHIQPVEASALEAFNELITNNPGINLVASDIIPK